MLFAQKAVKTVAGPAGPAPGFGNGGAPDAILYSILGFVCICLLIGLAIQIFFCLNLSNLLKAISKRNREVEPGEVWLLFIPFFNLYWIFALTGRIADSLANEYDDRRWRPDGDFGRQIGMWYGICAIAACVPYIGAIPGIASLVLWIIYWVKTAAWRKKLMRGAQDDFEDDRDEDYEDDHPRRDRDDDDRLRRKRRNDHDDFDR